MQKSLSIANDEKYKKWITDIKSRIRQSQIKAAIRVNTELLRLYAWSRFIRRLMPLPAPLDGKTV